MRPRRLVVEGLTCFRDRHDLDLGELEIFAITGPTGAGKSTLLDAISFALYGAVPRVKKDQRTELISMSSDRATVVLDFDLGGERYRISRVLRRSGASSARLERHDGSDFSVNLADQVRAADEKIEELLGMTVEAFQQAVMLPQGEFASFLEADPRERRKTLQSLLRLDVYERMRERANQVANRMKGSVESTKKLLAEEYRGVDSEALAALQEQHALVAAELEAKRREREEAQRALLGVQERFDKTSALLRCEEQAETLKGRESAVASLREQLEAARRAQPLRSLLDEVRLAREEVSRSADKQDRAEMLCSSTKTEFDAAELELAEAREAANGIATLRSKVADLHRVAGQLPEVKELEKSIERRRRQLADLNGQIGKWTSEFARAKAAVGVQSTRLKSAEEAMAAAGFNPELMELLELHCEQASSLAAARKAVATDQLALHEQSRSLGALEIECESLKNLDQLAELQVQRTLRALEQAQAGLERAEQCDAAGMLRRTLKTGEPCPVCEQTVHVLLGESLGAAVEEARGAVRDAKALLATAETDARARRRALDRAVDSLGVQRGAMESLTARCSSQERDVHREEAALLLAMSAHFSQEECGERVEEWVAASFSSQRARRKSYDEAGTLVEEAARLLERGQSDARNARERQAEREEDRRKADEDLAASTARFAQVRAEILAVSSSKDPAAEAESLLRQIDAVERREKMADDSLAELARTLAGHKAALLAATEATSQARAALQKREESRDLEMERAGFLDEETIALSLLSSDQIMKIEASVNAYELDVHAVQGRVRALRVELGDERISETSMREASSLARKLNDEVEGKSGEKNTLAQRIFDMKRRLTLAEEMRRRIEEEGRELQIHNQLATDLKSDRFQAYLLEGVFAELVRGASVRLRTLSSDRYSLLFKEDDIYVVDNDNAGNVRLIETLSGGETFLTSLALALELSEQVQRAAGAVRLDSLFIDEGFGTLDPDTLRTVSAAIQDLRVGGRMVGVITHIPELRDEFEQQIVVTKHIGYSTAEVRGAAS